MRNSWIALFALVLLPVRPAVGIWGYQSESTLRPDEKGTHPATHVMLLEATRLDPGPGCVCANWQTGRGEGRRGKITVVASILRPVRRTGEVVKVDEIELGPFRPQNFGSFTDVTACAPTTEVRSGDLLETRWTFSDMRPLRTGWRGTIFIRQSLSMDFGSCE